jgi:hypothetical protein
VQQSKLSWDWIVLIVFNSPIYWIFIRILFGGWSNFFSDFKNLGIGLIIPGRDGFDNIVIAFKLACFVALCSIALGIEHNLLFATKPETAMTQQP